MILSYIKVVYKVSQAKVDQSEIPEAQVTEAFCIRAVSEMSCMN